MTLETNVTKIGDSLYVLIPSFVAKQYNVENGTPLEMKIEGDIMIIIIKKQGGK